METLTRSDAIAILREGHEDLFDLCDGMSEDTMAKRPAVGEHWSVVDLLGHIETWEGLALDTLRDWKGRKEPTSRKRIAAAGGVDGFNAAEIETKRSQPAPSVTQSSGVTYQELIKAIEGLTEAEWMEPPFFETDRKETLGEMVGRVLGADAGLFRHIEDHIADLEAFAEKERWHNYLVATADKPPSPILDRLVPHLPSNGDAIDLGCGGGRSTRLLLQHGLRVTAVDAVEEAIQMVRDRLPEGAPVELVNSSFQDLKMGSYDVVIAIYSLFFLPPGEHESFWQRVVASVRPGGLFAGEFLGPNDDWRDRDYTLHAKEAVEKLFDNFDIIDFQEEEEDGETAVGDSKHWHVFHVIARKRG